MMKAETTEQIGEGSFGTMTYHQAKYCLDLNHIRWSLVEGIITRKNPHDAPTEGQDLPIQQITGVEKTTVQRVSRSRLGWPVTLFAVGLLALSAWTATISWLAAIPGGVVGILFLVWGVKRIPPRTEIIEAYRILTPAGNPDEWVVTGTIPEVAGFIAGVKAELEAKEKQAQQPAQP